MGCQFLAPTPELRSRILRFFDVEIAAASLLKVGKENLQTTSDGTPHWFNGEKGAELFYVVNAGQVVRFHASFLGNYVEGAQGKSLKCGQVMEDTGGEGPRYKGSNLIKWDPARHEEIRGTFLKFIEAIEGLPGDDKTAILKALAPT